MSTEKYIRTRDRSKLFARDADGRPYYARNADGDEIYPVVDGLPVPLIRFREDERERDDGNVVYARRRSGDAHYPVSPEGGEFMWGGTYARNRRGEPFYPKDADGHEYAPRGEYIFVGSVLRYPLSAQGRPLYPTDPVRRRPYYVYDDASGRYHIGRDRDGRPAYARMPNDDGETSEAYPPDCSYAFAKDGVTPVYAKNSRGEAVFPECPRGDEIYLRHGRTLDDFVEDEGVVRYAVDRTDREVYPRKLGPDGVRDVLIGNRYALDSDRSPYYPSDGSGHEYYVSWTPEKTEEDVILDRYAVSNTGRFVVPSKGDAPYFSNRVLPRMGPENVAGVLDRSFDDPPRRDYLTDVVSDLSPAKARSRGGDWGILVFHTVVLLGWFAGAAAILK